MLKLVLVAVLAAVVIAQLNIVVDSILNFRVEYDDTHDIVLMVSDSDCYIVEAPDAKLDSVIADKDVLNQATEEMYAQIQSGSGVTSMTHQEASNEYHSRLEAWQCRRKDVHKIAYTPPSSN